MATHTVAVRDSITNGVVDQLDTGTGTPSFIFQTAGDVEVATLAMDGTNAFDDSGSAGGNADGVATANAIADDTSATGGVTTKCKLTDRDDLDIIFGTVGTSGTDIIISDTTIPVGATVQISSLIYTAPL